MQETRLFFTSTLLRVATPFREVTWADFLLADVLTSLAKALSDTERAICLLASGPIMQPHDSDQVCPCFMMCFAARRLDFSVALRLLIVPHDMFLSFAQ